ncbi:MAG: acyltransferase [Acidimicrobiales bacterium]
MAEHPHPPVDPDNFAAFGPHSVIHAPVLSVPNPSGVHVGSWVNIGSYAVIEALVPERGVTVHIDDGVYIGHFLRLTAMTEVRIGAEAMLSDRVYVSDTGHEYDDITIPIKRQPLLDGRRVEIGAGAWIGIGAVIVGNIRIGTNAVVAANSVVREDVDDFTVVAGDPARVIRRHDGSEWEWTDPR